MTRAAVEGGILGWPCYDEHGLAGLNPDESCTYCLDPAAQRPPAWFSLPGDDVYVADGYADENLAYFTLKPIPASRAATKAIFLNASSAPRWFGWTERRSSRSPRGSTAGRLL